LKPEWTEHFAARGLSVDDRAKRPARELILPARKNIRPAHPIEISPRKMTGDHAYVGRPMTKNKITNGAPLIQSAARIFNT